jgi:hypothetical protein
VKNGTLKAPELVGNGKMEPMLEVTRIDVKRCASLLQHEIKSAIMGYEINICSAKKSCFQVLLASLPCVVMLASCFVCVSALRSSAVSSWFLPARLIGVPQL